MYPVLFHFGSVVIHSYGVMLMLGFLAGLALARRQAPRHGLSPEVALDLGVWILLASILLARALFLALSWHEHPVSLLDMVAVWREGGLSFFGGLAGGIAATLLYAHRRGSLSGPWRMPSLQASPWAMRSPGSAASSTAVATACRRKLPWGIVFPGVTTEPVHPTQLYSSAGSLLLMAILLWLQPRLKARGQLFVAYVMLYAVLRGVVEIFRAGATAEPLWGHSFLTQAQGACLALLVIGAFVFHVLGKRTAREAAPNPRERRSREVLRYSHGNAEAGAPQVWLGGHFSHY